MSMTESICMGSGFKPCRDPGASGRSAPTLHTHAAVSTLAQGNLSYNARCRAAKPR